MRNVLAVVAVVLLGRSATAAACSCQAPGPPCASLYFSTVFVGTATSVVEKNGAAMTTFAVTDVLHAKSPLGKTVDVAHSTIGSMCGLTFDKGKTYVVYASGEAGQLSAGACTRTHLLHKGDEDVAYAHAEVTRTDALVEGTVVLSDGDKSNPHPGVEVRAVGTTLSAKSDAKGKFKLLLPPGQHVLEVATPGLRFWQGEAPKVNLPVAAACATPVVMVAWDGRIEGRVTTADGKPVAGLEVYALAKRAQDRRWRVSARTDADGKYVIHQVPAGDFYVGVSVPDFSGMDVASPYPTTYFPGTPELKAAKTVPLERAGLKSGVDFVVPAARVVRTLRGALRRKDGSLVPHASVEVTPQGRNRSTGLATDAKGAFLAQELDGEEVVVRGCFGIDGKLVCAEEKRKLTGDVTVDLVLPK